MWARRSEMVLRIARRAPHDLAISPTWVCASSEMAFSAGTHTFALSFGDSTREVAHEGAAPFTPFAALPAHEASHASVWLLAKASPEPARLGVLPVNGLFLFPLRQLEERVVDWSCPVVGTRVAVGAAVELHAWIRLTTTMRPGPGGPCAATTRPRTTKS